jgi:hypothetical protein
MKNPLAAALLLLTMPTLALAKPNPEVQKLGYYVGTWQGHGETKGGPFGAAGKLSSRQTCTWFEGRSQVVCRGHEQGPSGKRDFLNILAYDVKAKAYTEYSISSFGEAEYDQGGSWVGNTLTFFVDQDARGKPAKFRYSEAHLSAALYSYRAEVELTGKPWTVLAQGKIRKVK